jgi:serine protease Do
LYGDEDELYEARVIGRDPLTDSALIELTEKPDHALPEVKFGDSGQIFPGDWVVAIGNPFGLSHTVTVGVISAIARSFPVAESRYAQVLQTDAAINPGNSGGPLLNLRGEVVGINTAIISEGRPGNVGVGFAMPINVVRELLPQLRAGKITRGRIGVGIGAIPADAVDEFGLKDRNGAVVLNVAPGGAAAKAGIEPGDVIIGYNGKAIRNRDELVAMVTATKPGTSVPVRLFRDRQERSVNVTVEELDLDAEGASQRAGNDNGGGGGAQEATSGFGITLGNVTPELAQRLRLNRNTTGAVILNVEPGSTAARAGLAEGDVIVRVGRENVSNATDASRELGRVPSGSTAFLRVVRNGQETFVSVAKE